MLTLSYPIHFPKAKRMGELLKLLIGDAKTKFYVSPLLRTQQTFRFL